MAGATNQWKVGAFVIGSVTTVVASLFWLGASRFDTEVVERVTYLDESVQGLEVGAPIKIRGVTIGKVTDILLAPDRRLVEVRTEVRVEALRRLNVVAIDEEVANDRTDVSSDIRITVASQGITGIKFLEADFFPKNTPMIELSFEPPDNYIPSTPSTLKGLEDAIRGIGEELPHIVSNLRELTATMEQKLASLDTERMSTSISKLAEDMSAMLDGSAEAGLGADLSALMADLRTVTKRVDDTVIALTAEDGWAERGLSSVESLAAELRRAVERTNSAIEQADLPATSQSIRGAADATARLAEGLQPSGAEMTAALVELQRALRTIENLASLLERDPGVLLRGRATGSKR